MFSVDIEPAFNVDLVKDVLLMTRHDLPWRPDIVLASPPCEAFSVLRIGHNWTKPTDDPPNSPKTDKARLALRLVERTREIIGVLDPQFFVIENPRDKLRRLAPVLDLERRTVTYCQYGEPFMKPTDLWGGFPPSLVLKPPCRNGDTCHQSAPRGSTTGIQGNSIAAYAAAIREKEPHRMTTNKTLVREHYGTSKQSRLAALRSKIPYPLSLSICLAAEKDLT